MEEEKNLFGLNFDSQSKSFLAESAKWGKFLAIVGFVACGLMILVGLYFLTAKNPYEDMYPSYSRARSEVAGMRIGMFIGMVFASLLYFFPCLYLYRFATQAKAALESENQESLTLSMQNLKSMFKFMGILTIILIAFYVLGLLASLGS